MGIGKQVSLFITMVSIMLVTAMMVLPNINFNNTRVNAYPTSGGNVTYGEKVENKITLVAEEQEGNIFIGWFLDGQVIGEDKKLIVDSSLSIDIEARFEKIQVEITLEISKNNGGHVEGFGTYSYGEQVELKAVPKMGYGFDGWYHGSTKLSSELRYAFKASESKTIEGKFSLNLDEYSSNLTVIDGDYLLALVNKEITLGEYRPKDLVKIPEKMVRDNPNQYLRNEAYIQLEKMWNDAKSQGIDLYIASAFRSYETQKIIFSNYASTRGEQAANRFSARAGQSEHQLGTTVDIVGNRSEGLTAEFGRTEAGIWLQKHAYKYGFAMSYPENKEHITGYIYEPWHWRYIGIEAATQWKESGLTLVEFLKTKPQEFKQ